MGIGSVYGWYTVDGWIKKIAIRHTVEPYPKANRYRNRYRMFPQVRGGGYTAYTVGAPISKSLEKEKIV